MTTQTLRNGQSVDIVVPSGQSLGVVAVSGTYNATTIAGVTLGSIASAATGGTYGPYTGGGAEIRLTASATSEIDFEVAVTPNIASDTVALIKTDPLAGRINRILGGTRDAMAGIAVDAVVGSGLYRSEYKAAVYSPAPTVTEGGAQTVGSTLFQANNSVFRYSNNLMAPVTLVGQVGTAYSGRNRADATGLLTTSGVQWAVEFDYYGQVLEPYVYSAVGCLYWVWVDGKPVTAAPAQFTATANSFNFKRHDFGSFARRRIRIEGRGVNAAFNGVRSGSTVHVTAPSEERPSVLAWVGDSYADGRKATDEMTGFLRALGRKLGLEAWQFPSLGGQGLIFGTTHISRLPTDLLPIPNVKVVVIQASINDINGTWSGTVGPAAVACIDWVRLNMPNVQKIVVVSPLAVLSPATYAMMNTQIKAAVLAAYPDVPYIDVITTPWVTGTGKVGTTTGDGIADVAADADGTHPTQIGHDILAETLGSKLALALGFSS